jgi:hypothetical protein
MAIIEIHSRDGQGQRQFFLGHLLTVAVLILGFFYGLNLRNGVIFATQPYNNIQAGIRLDYPSRWLIDSGGEYVLQIRDMQRVGYKTTMQLSLRPAGVNVAARNILDLLNISRALTLSTYDVQSIEPYTLPNGTQGTMMSYTFVDTETNKFLETVPVVVNGLDILVRRGDQALIITFRGDSLTFDQDIATFNRMLSSLEF